MYEKDKVAKSKDIETEKMNIAINDEKKNCTWLYQMNLKKRQICGVQKVDDPFCSCKYHFSLLETLFV